MLVFKDLTHHGYDVFIDYDGIASGDFEHAIVENIKGRAHFVVLLTPTALDRCSEPKDWFRREIEAAIAAQRNIVPILLRGCDMNAPAISEKLAGSLEPLGLYQALEAPDSFFDEALERLRTKYLNVPLDAVIHPPSHHATQVALEQQHAAVSAASAPTSEQPTPVPPPILSQRRTAVPTVSKKPVTATPVMDKLNEAAARAIEKSIARQRGLKAHSLDVQYDFASKTVPVAGVVPDQVTKENIVLTCGKAFEVAQVNDMLTVSGPFYDQIRGLLQKPK